MQLAMIDAEQMLDDIRNELGDGWDVCFRFAGSVVGWTIALEYGASKTEMWESDPFDHLEEAVQHVVDNRRSILSELED